MIDGKAGSAPCKSIPQFLELSENQYLLKQLWKDASRSLKLSDPLQATATVAPDREGSQGQKRWNSKCDASLSPLTPHFSPEDRACHRLRVF